jgi:hypothetical protein
VRELARGGASALRDSVRLGSIFTTPASQTK